MRFIQISKPTSRRFKRLNRTKNKLKLKQYKLKLLPSSSFVLQKPQLFKHPFYLTFRPLFYKPFFKMFSPFYFHVTKGYRFFLERMSIKQKLKVLKFKGKRQYRYPHTIIVKKLIFKRLNFSFIKRLLQSLEYLKSKRLFRINKLTSSNKRLYRANPRTFSFLNKRKKDLKGVFSKPIPLLLLNHTKYNFKYRLKRLKFNRRIRFFRFKKLKTQKIKMFRF